MIYNARQALKNAYAPYSNYCVSACIRSNKNTLFVGVNVENCSYGLTQCAETSAICQMVTHGHRRIQSMVLMSHDNQLCAPCGACRQRIFEFSSPTVAIHLCDQQTILKTVTINDLLPLAFKLKGTHDE